MLTSVNSPSSLLQVVSNGDDEDDDELEFRSYVDDAWYSVRVAFDGRAGGKLIVRYCNFPDDNDSVYEAGKFFSFDELDDFASRFRPVSVQLQDSECRDVVADGLLVCASHAFTDNDVLFYVAVVEQVRYGEEECLCSFLLVWQHGPNANSLTEKKIESICIVQSIQNLNPNLASFIKMAKEKIRTYAHKSSSVSDAAGTNFSDVGVQSLKQASQPWVVAKNFSRHDIFRASSIGTPMFASQRKLQYVNCGKGDELKVVRSGTEEYKTAKELRDLLVEFTSHQERLHKSLAFEERKILKSSPELERERGTDHIYNIYMEKLWCLKHVMVLTMVGVLSFGGITRTEGIRFDIDREECFSYNVHYEGVTLHLSFVFIKADTPWHFKEDGVDLVVYKGPSGEQIHDFRDKASEKYEFVVRKKGVYHFCFTNKSPYHETIDFDIYVGHFIQYDQHAKDEHFSPLLEQISKLEEALHNIQFEQHWLEAQTDRQAIVNDHMSKRAIQKAVIESLSLVATSFLQVFLLKYLFNRKHGSSRV
ncbi:hypothetical protein EZV62_020816 [Acer yangbiense]|uniref:GOLD domain-containing protein n=1 Tax=Acer yangbiense TaxID=1000413 RepID=A0A5C7HEV6_9ROSI|nr:hypothetical protein EZV62_020816 [Acer yangbiense]